MPQTQIQNGNALAVKEYSVALFAQAQKKPGFQKNLTGQASQQGNAEAKLKQQSSPDMPIVRVTDLAKTSGDTVSVDCVDITTGKPIMGDRNAEGKGKPLTFSSMDVKIDMATYPIDAGGKMTQQRTKHELRKLALANGAGYMARLESQLCHIHLAGARGSLDRTVFPVPLSTDPDFAEICVNPIKAPTYNRHYVVSGSGATLTQGGAQLASITTADVGKLDMIDNLRLLLDDMEFPLQSVKIADDPAASDEPMWVLMCPPRVFESIKTASGSNLRSFQQQAWERASYGSKHPLFMGEVGMWNGILVRKVSDYYTRFAAGSTVAYNQSTDTAGQESGSAIIPALSGTHAVERCLLLGAQALANVYGKSQAGDFYYGWLERKYNFDRATEVACETMAGKAKLRFNVPQADGTKHATDHGVIAVDVAVRL